MFVITAACSFAIQFSAIGSPSIKVSLQWLHLSKSGRRMVCCWLNFLKPSASPSRWLSVYMQSFYQEILMHLHETSHISSHGMDCLVLLQWFFSWSLYDNKLKMSMSNRKVYSFQLTPVQNEHLPLQLHSNIQCVYLVSDILCPFPGIKEYYTFFVTLLTF